MLITLHLQCDHRHLRWGCYFSWAYIWGQGWTLQAGGPEKLPPLQQKRAGVSWGQEEGGCPHPCPQVAPSSAARWASLGLHSWVWQSVFTCCILLWCLCWFRGIVRNFFFLPFFSRLSNWKSFDTQCPFTQGQFLIDTPHRLSSPKYVLSEEFPSSCSFMERSLKSQGDPEPVWALAFAVSQPVLPNWWTRGEISCYWVELID